MAEITLEGLRKKNNEAGFAAELPENERVNAHEYVLTPGERARADEIREQIDMTDSQMLMLYGSGVQQNIADFSQNILNHVKNRDFAYAGDLMNDLVQKVEEMDFDSLKPQGGIAGLFRKPEAGLKKFTDQYQALELQIDAIEGKLDEARMGLLKDIGIFDTLYEKNLAYFKQLELYIAAGEEKLDEVKNDTIPALRSQAEKSGNPMDTQLVRDFENTVSQFEKRVYDLKTSRLIALQMAPQIRLIQNNDRLLADKIQMVLKETIPLWKSQMVMALGMYRQEETRKLQHSAIEAGENLIGRMNEALKVQRQGCEKRAAAEEELQKLEENIRLNVRAL